MGFRKTHFVFGLKRDSRLQKESKPIRRQRSHLLDRGLNAQSVSMVWGPTETNGSTVRMTDTADERTGEEKGFQTSALWGRGGWDMRHDGHFWVIRTNLESNNDCVSSEGSPGRKRRWM